MLLQLLFIHLPPTALKDTINLDQQIAGNNNNTTATAGSSPTANQFKITLKLDPELLSMNLENFKIIVDTQSLYEPITISLQQYFFDQDKQTELSIFYLSNVNQKYVKTQTNMIYNPSWYHILTFFVFRFFTKIRDKFQERR